MKHEFIKIKSGNKTRYVLESGTSGGTSAGDVATSSPAMGSIQRRKPGQNLIAREDDKYAKISVPSTTPRNFVAKNAKTGGAGAHRDKKKEQKQGKEKHKKPFIEQGMTESDGVSKDKEIEFHTKLDKLVHNTFGKRKGEMEEHDNLDHEISMASHELLSIIEDANRLLKLVRRYSEMEGLEAWQQSKITKAADYLNAVLNNLQGKSLMHREDHSNFNNGWGQGSYDTYAGGRHGRGVAESLKKIYSDKIPKLSGLPFSELDRLSESSGADFSNFDQALKKNLNLPNWTNTLELYGVYLRKLIEHNSGKVLCEDEQSDVEQELFKQLSQRSNGSIDSASVGDRVSLLHLTTLNIPGHKIVARLNGFLTPKEIVNITDAGEFQQLEFADGSRYPEKDGGNIFQQTQGWNMTKLFPSYDSASKAYMFYALVGKKLSKDLDFQTNVEQGTEESQLSEKAPPGMEKDVLRLKKQYPGQPEKAFATAWMIYNRKHGKKDETVSEISDTTKQSYKQKAQDQVKELEPWTKKGEYRDIAKRAIVRREKGLARVKEDSYIEELAAKMAEKLDPNADIDVWVQDFQKADPNRYHQFKNKTPEKKARMAVAARYAAKNPSKK